MPANSTAASSWSTIDRVTVGQPVDALGAGKSSRTARPTRVSRSATASHWGAPTDRGHRGGVAVAIHAAVVEDVGEGVPVGRRLQRQDHAVVGVADPARDRFAEQALGAGGVFGAGQGRVAHAVVAAEVAGLRAVEVEGEAEPDDLAELHRAGGVADDPAGDQVGGAALVVGSPATPVGVLGDVLVEDVALGGRPASVGAPGVAGHAAAAVAVGGDAHAGSGIEVFSAPLRPRISRASSGVAGSSESSSRIRTVLSTWAAFDSASTPRRR